MGHEVSNNLYVVCICTLFLVFSLVLLSSTTFLHMNNIVFPFLHTHHDTATCLCACACLVGSNSLHLSTYCKSHTPYSYPFADSTYTVACTCSHSPSCRSHTRNELLRQDKWSWREYGLWRYGPVGFPRQLLHLEGRKTKNISEVVPGCVDERDWTAGQSEPETNVTVMRR